VESVEVCRDLTGDPSRGGGGIGGKGGHKRRSATFLKVHGHEILSIENLKPPLNEKIGPLI
jgi:hypothetical protein